MRYLAHNGVSSRAKGVNGEVVGDALRPQPTADGELMRFARREASGGHRDDGRGYLGWLLGGSRGGGSAEAATEAAEVAVEAWRSLSPL